MLPLITSSMSGSGRPLGVEGEEMGSLELIGSCAAAIRRAVRDMLPVSKCMGYISIPRALWGQA